MEEAHGVILREAMPSVRKPLDQEAGEETVDAMDPGEQVLSLRALQRKTPGGLQHLRFPGVLSGSRGRIMRAT